MIYDLKYLLFCLFLVVTILIFLNDIKSKSVKPFEMIAAKTNLEESSLKVNATDNDAQKHTRNPDLIHIKLNNSYWQVYSHESKSIYYLYAAYYDKRTKTPTIRITAYMEEKNKSNRLPLCLLWYPDSSEPLVSQLEITIKPFIKRRIMKLAKELLLKTIVSCPLPDNQRDKVPVSVSIVGTELEMPTNLLKVIYNKPSFVEKRNKFMVCSKGHTFPALDISFKFVEWIETLRALGADVSIYYFQMPPNMLKVLDYYTSKGLLDVSHVTIPGNEKFNEPEVQYQYLMEHSNRNFLNHFGWVHLQDCLYRNLYLYDYVMVTDYDEIFVSKKQLNFEKMIQEIVNVSEPYQSYRFRNTYFMDKMQKAHGFEPDVPEYFTMMKHVYRSVITTDQFKCMHKMDEVLGLNLHRAQECLDGKCREVEVNDTIASWHHYRSSCAMQYVRNNTCNSCNSPQTKTPICKDLENESIRDTSIWSVKEDVVVKVNSILEELGFLT